MATGKFSAQWDKATTMERVTAANYDVFRHPEFSVLAGVVSMGRIELFDKYPTAATDGENVFYNPEFMMKLDRKQTRFVVLHENFHKSLKHCLRLNTDFARANHALVNTAIDFVVNDWIYHGDPEFKFMDWPTEPAPLLEPKYFGWSAEQILRDMMQRGGKPKPKGLKPQGPTGKRGEPGKTTIGIDDVEIQNGGGASGGNPMDGHMPANPGKGGESDGQPGDGPALENRIDNAVRQGKILSQKLRSQTGTGGKLNLDQLTETKVDWREVLREFFQETCKGVEMARWSKINTRIFSASGVCLPTLYDEKVGAVGIFGDTSGSMHPYYPILFGEVAAICQTAKPESVLMLWWDTEVAGVQRFTERDYPSIKDVIAPAGGGGTEPKVAYDWLVEHNEKVQCAIWISDGEIGPEPANPLGVPVLWCIVGNRRFTPRTGKVVYIDV